MSWLTKRFQSFDDKRAIIYKGESYTYKQLYNEIEKIKMSLLADQIKSGEVVCVLSDYSFESISLMLALADNKNIIVPITSKLQNEIEERVDESYCDKVITLDDTAYKIVKKDSNEKHPIIQRLQQEKSAGLILFSSGSTGKPKAMIHNFDNLIDHYIDKKEKSINMLLFLMLDHIGGINTLLNALAMGATLIIPQNRNADDICKLVQEYQIKVLPSSPTFLNLIVMSKAYEKYDLDSLRMITYGTETMPESLLNKLKKIFPNAKFLQTFGTSETGIANTVSRSSNSTFMKIDDPNLEYKIVDDELWLKSRTQVMGYLNASMENFTQDGWFMTGDLVELADDDYIKIIGRNKDVINIGGEKVLPTEIESVILEIDEIEDVIVYAKADAITGQTIVCDVVLTVPMEAREVKKIIRQYCKERLARYKLPTKVNVVEKTDFSDRFKKIRRK